MTVVRRWWMRKRKRQGGEGRWGAYQVDRDEHGVWLYTPEGSRYRGTGPDGAVTEICTPAVLDGDGWSYVDLELDLLKSAGGTGDALEPISDLGA